MNHRNTALAFAAACGLALLALSPPARSATQRTSQEKLYEQVELLAEAITVVQSDYVEEVDPKKLIYGAMRGMVDALDRHSQFLDPDAYSEMQVETKGEFGGVGLEITLAKDGTLTVVAPMDDTPAAKMGLHPQDKIVKIDGESTRGISLHEAVTKLRGRPGTSVVLSILREEDNHNFDVSLTRAVIQIRSVKQAKTPAENIGYIRISEFQDHTAKDLDRALAQYKDEELEGLILDLRNNPGGLLDVAVEVSGRFIPEGKTVLSTKGRVPSQNQTFTSTYKSPHIGFPMVILINEGSASASEIVAGALRDHGRAILMGSKSFGKGSVQTVVPLRDGSAVRLTTSIYYTPAGHAIHGKGLEPDVLAEEKKGDPGDEEIVEPEKDGGYMRDPVVLRAVDLLKGLSIFQTKQQS
ncbi:MAG: S41 family peptidase [Candidatus Omnitrophica bacterium]|nr:S41 family peptidase [Candidatus Omnitrophota bacterium]